MSWRSLYDHWAEIILDIHELFGVDLDDDDVRARISWHWFETRVEGLIGAPPRAWFPDGHAIPSNRLQWALSDY